MKNNKINKPGIPTCPHLGKEKKILKHFTCNHEDKNPGFRLCVKESTCPLFVFTNYKPFTIDWLLKPGLKK